MGLRASPWTSRYDPERTRRLTWRFDSRGSARQLSCQRVLHNPVNLLTIISRSRHCVRLKKIFFTKFDIFSSWSGDICSKVFFCGMGKNNTFDGDVETLYLKREWRQKDELIADGKNSVVCTIPPKGNFPSRIFETKFGFQTFTKNTNKCVVVRLTKTMNRTSTNSK